MVCGQDSPVFGELGSHLDSPNLPGGVAHHAPLEVLLLEVRPADVSLRCGPTQESIGFGQTLEALPYSYGVGTPVYGDNARRAVIWFNEQLVRSLLGEVPLN